VAPFGCSGLTHGPKVLFFPSYKWQLTFADQREPGTYLSPNGSVLFALPIAVFTGGKTPRVSFVWTWLTSFLLSIIG
jgi:hypothetical protein